MVRHWDDETREPGAIPTVIPFDPLDDEADEPYNRWAALMFVIWSVFMIALGFMIAMVVQGHIIIK